MNVGCMIFLRDLSCFFNVDALFGMLVQRYGQKKSGATIVASGGSLGEFWWEKWQFRGLRWEFLRILANLG